MKEYLNCMIETTLFSGWLFSVCGVQNSSSSLCDMPHSFPCGIYFLLLYSILKVLCSAQWSSKSVATRAHITNCFLDSMPDAHFKIKRSKPKFHIPIAPNLPLCLLTPLFFSICSGLQLWGYPCFCLSPLLLLALSLKKQTKNKKTHNIQPVLPAPHFFPVQFTPTSHLSYFNHLSLHSLLPSLNTQVFPAYSQRGSQHDSYTYIHYIPSTLIQNSILASSLIQSKIQNLCWHLSPR